MAKLHPDHQSALHRVGSHKRLAKVLMSTVNEIESLKSLSCPYNKWPDKKGRLIENPIPELKRIQRRVGKLLSKIEYPSYLHSAVKDRSYRSNAKAHTKYGRMVKTDIRKFYPRTSRSSVFQFFRRDLKCAPDVSDTLAQLLTCEGHLPTGGPASPILSYYVNKHMFDGLSKLAERLGVRMSVYVDDVVFSGEQASKRLLAKVKKIISSHGYTTHKDAMYGRDQTKTVTGVTIKDGKLLLPNRRHKNIGCDLAALRKCSAADGRESIMPVILGRLNEASQLDERFDSLYRTLRAEKLRMKSKR